MIHIFSSHLPILVHRYQIPYCLRAQPEMFMHRTKLRIIMYVQIIGCLNRLLSHNVSEIKSIKLNLLFLYETHHRETGNHTQSDKMEESPLFYVINFPSKAVLASPTVNSNSTLTLIPCPDFCASWKHCRLKVDYYNPWMGRMLLLQCFAIHLIHTWFSSIKISDLPYSDTTLQDTFCCVASPNNNSSVKEDPFISMQKH